MRLHALPCGVYACECVHVRNCLSTNRGGDLTYVRMCVNNKVNTCCFISVLLRTNKLGCCLRKQAANQAVPHGL